MTERFDFLRHFVSGGNRRRSQRRRGSRTVGGLMQRRRACGFEQLEDRRLLAQWGPSSLVTVSGIVWHDLNHDGYRNDTEPGLAGWTVTAHCVDNSQQSDQTAVSGPQGIYTLQLSPGLWLLREVVQTGWYQTAPEIPYGDGSALLQLQDVQEFPGPFFGNVHAITVSGIKWNDLNGNGIRESNEPGLNGWTIYADSMTDFATTPPVDSYSGQPAYSTFPADYAAWLAQGNVALQPMTIPAVTSAVTSGGNGHPDGYYELYLRPGNYTIREAVQAGWTQTAPASITYTVSNLQDDQPIVNKDFGNQFTGATIQGKVWNDLNYNGLLDPNPVEPGLTGWQVYADTNGNGSFDPGERVATTDANGDYSLVVNASSGTVTIREVLQTPWFITYPSAKSYTLQGLQPGQIVTGKSFGDCLGGTIKGQVWNDFDHDGVYDPGEFPLGGWQIYADLNNGNGSLDSDEPVTTSDSTGKYSLVVPAGNMTIREVVRNGWFTSCPSGGAYPLQGIQPGQVVTDRSFGNYVGGTIVGNVWNDLNANGLHEFTEPGVNGWTVYAVDVNSGAVYSAVTVHGNLIDGTYGISVPVGTYTIRVMPQPNWPGWGPTPAPTPAPVTIANSGQSTRGPDFGVRYAMGTVTGTKWNDLNGNGRLDQGETPLSGWTIYLAPNPNDPFDVNDPHSDPTDANGNYVIAAPSGIYWVREVPQTGWIRTGDSASPITVVIGQTLAGQDVFNIVDHATLRGTKWNDLNGNGQYDPGETPLSGWTITLTSTTGVVVPPTVTDTNGNYQFTVPSGSYLLGEVQQPGWLQTNGPLYPISLQAGETRAGVDLFNTNNLATIRGTKWNDLDGNGQHDPGEPGIDGWTIYQAPILGIQHYNASAITDSYGRYELTVAAGTVTICETPQPGWVATSPTSITMPVDGGQTYTNVDFLNVQDFGWISGTVWNDANGNKVQDNEEGLPGRQVYDDVNGNSRYDPPDPFQNQPGEPTTWTGNGGYYMLQVPSGVHTIREVLPAGWLQTTPLSDSYTVVVAAGHTVADKNFGCKVAPAPVAQIYRNRDYSPIQPNSVYTSEWPVDLHFEIQSNVPLDLTTVVLVFSGVSSKPDAGTFQGIQVLSIVAEPDLYKYLVTVRVAQGIGRLSVDGTAADIWGNYISRFVTDPNSNYVDIIDTSAAASAAAAAPSAAMLVKTTWTASHVSPSTGRDPQLATIAGSIINDLNRNGRPDSNEPGLAGRLVFADTNNNGSLDPGEPSALTDANGVYYLDVAPGSYAIRQASAAGWSQTWPAQPYTVTAGPGAVVVDRDFGDYASVPTFTVGSRTQAWPAPVLTTQGPSLAAPEKAVLSARVSPPPSGAIASVTFYAESNGQSGYQSGSDRRVGVASFHQGTWTASVSTAGLPAGTLTFYAVAISTDGRRSLVGAVNISRKPTTGSSIHLGPAAPTSAAQTSVAATSTTATAAVHATPVALRSVVAATPVAANPRPSAAMLQVPSSYASSGRSSLAATDAVLSSKDAWQPRFFTPDG